LGKWSEPLPNLLPKWNLIPVGGGKDSFVTLDLLKGSHENNPAFIINPLPSAVASAAAAGYEGERCIILKRTLDQNMLELNKKGYLNGHTPFSALAAFAAYMTAVLYGKKFITLSNESSANESTIKDSSVNHQYSKSFEFEQDFQTYTAEYLNPDIRYFSRFFRRMNNMTPTEYREMIFRNDL
jgi:AraC-like DNA-binding protein